MKKGGSLIAIGLVSLVFVSAYGGYLYTKKSKLVAKSEVLASTLIDAENKLLEYEEANVFNAINANNAFKDLSASIVSWSKVIGAVNKMIPEDTIEVLSYSFSGENTVSISVRTIGKQNSYVTVANLIKIIDESPYFTGIFVPSVSEGLDAKGHETASFSFTIQYLADGSGALKSNLGEWDIDSIDIGSFDDFGDENHTEVDGEESVSRGDFSNEVDASVSR